MKEYLFGLINIIEKSANVNLQIVDVDEDKEKEAPYMYEERTIDNVDLVNLKVNLYNYDLKTKKLIPVEKFEKNTDKIKCLVKIKKSDNDDFNHVFLAVTPKVKSGKYVKCKCGWFNKERFFDKCTMCKKRQFIFFKHV